MTYDISNLVNYYFDQAKRCIDAECFTASIAMSWATVEHAIEHELRGGSRLFGDLDNPDGLQLPGAIEFSLKNIDKKLDTFFENKFQNLSNLRPLIKELYDYRNIFLHGKVDHVAHIPDESDPRWFMRKIEIHEIDTQSSYGKNWHIYNELELIHSSRPVALHCFGLAQKFLDRLNEEVKKIPQN